MIRSPIPGLRWFWTESRQFSSLRLRNSQPGEMPDAGRPFQEHEKLQAIPLQETGYRPWQSFFSPLQARSGYRNWRGSCNGKGL